MFRFFISDLRRNIIKILCLSIGLSIGLVLVARVYCDKTYDSFFTNADRIYMLYGTIERDGEFEKDFTVSGGYAPRIKKDFPQIESATRFINFDSNLPFELEDGRKLIMPTLCLSDENIFDVFDIPVTGGDPKEILQTENVCIIPRSYAVQIGGEVIGMTITLPKISENKKYTIAGVYDDLPVNSSIPNAFYFSLNSLPDRTQGRDELMGNDIYNAYIRLEKDAQAQDVSQGIRNLVKENVPKEFLDMLKFDLGIQKLTSFYSTQEEIKTMDWMLMLLAVILIFSSSLNFLLIVIGQMGKRSKEMAIRKCYGTSDINIFRRVMGESIFYLIVSVLFGILFIACFPELCERLLNYTPMQLLTIGGVWTVISVICLFTLFLTGVIPAWIYCRTPVASAFRGSVGNRRRWKMLLLSIQFFASGVLLCLLVLIVRQYRLVTDIDRGFVYDDIAWISLNGTTHDERTPFISELRALSCVEDVATSSSMIGRSSGNNVWLSGQPENIVNVADNYYANSNLFEMMGMNFIQGETFNPQADSTINQVIVEKAFIDVLKQLSGEDTDNIIGKTFHMTEHGQAEYTICGVIEDIRRGNLQTADKRAGVWFPSSRNRVNIYVKLDAATPENIQALQEVTQRVFPDSEDCFETLKSVYEAESRPIRNFAIAVLIAGIAILFIAFVGLVGYTGDEIQRRAREISIRKVTGTSTEGIIMLFSKNILAVAVPSLIAGGAVAIIAGRRWLSQFQEQVSLSPFSIVLCVIVLLLIIVGVVVYNTFGVASANPVDHLRDE